MPQYGRERYAPDRRLVASEVLDRIEGDLVAGLFRRELDSRSIHEAQGVTRFEVVERTPQAVTFRITLWDEQDARMLDDLGTFTLKADHT